MSDVDLLAENDVGVDMGTGANDRSGTYGARTRVPVILATHRIPELRLADQEVLLDDYSFAEDHSPVDDSAGPNATATTNDDRLRAAG
jgi:hypothetical protein